MRSILVALCLVQPAAALELTLRDFHDLDRPSSLEFDPAFCGLWIANESAEAILATLDGTELRRISSDLFRIKAITLEGETLLLADGLGRYQRFGRDGESLGAPVRLGEGAVFDVEGLAVDGDGTLIAVEDDPAQIVWLDPVSGAALRRIDGMTLSPAMTEPQGIARDPRTGRLLVVDDWEGTNSLFEFDPDGTLVAVEPLIAWGRDPEGIALRVSTSTLYVAFDEGARIASFDYVPSPGAAELPQAPSADCAFM